jgi:hypothetical protein
MTPIKNFTTNKGFFNNEGGGTVVSGMMPSLDGDDLLDYRIYSERGDDDNTTLKNYSDNQKSVLI